MTVSSKQAGKEERCRQSVSDFFITSQQPIHRKLIKGDFIAKSHYDQHEPKQLNPKLNVLFDITKKGANKNYEFP